MCLDGSFMKKPCSKNPCPPQCAHLKIAIVNNGNATADVGLQVLFCDPPTNDGDGGNGGADGGGGGGGSAGNLCSVHFDATCIIRGTCAPRTQNNSFASKYTSVPLPWVCAY